MPTNVEYMLKDCEACGQEYEPESPRNKTCTVCTPDKSSKHRWRRYRITKPQFDEMLKKQGNKCPLCKCHLLVDIDTVVDHCHATMKFRGILCRGCNMVVARFEDEDYAMRVNEYLLGGDLTIVSKEEAQSYIPRL